MNVAGPSRVPSSGRLAPRGRVESTYETDLVGLLDHLSLDEIDDVLGVFARQTAPLSDRDIAMNDLLQQARWLAIVNQDRALAQRVAAGEDISVNPRPAQVQVRPEVQRAGAVPQPNNQRAVTQQNDHQPRGTQVARNNSAPSQTWGTWLSSMANWMFGSPTGPGQAVNLNTPSVTPKQPAGNRPTGHDCVICQDPIRGAEVRAPCGHYYDIGCITDLFQSATKDETLYPPRCCRQNISFVQVRPHLTQALITTFLQKQVEFGTLKRVYCSAPACSRFLGPLSEGVFGSVFTCPAPCGKRTCSKCREGYDDWSHVCRPDSDAAGVLALGRAAGWARCPGCSQMIELHHGCFHMTCRCRTEFCYVCRARWKTCRCPQWDEGRLLTAAEQRVDAQLGVAPRARQPLPPPPPPAPPAPRRPPVPVHAPPPAPAPNPRLVPRVNLPNTIPAPAPAPVPLPAWQRPVAPVAPPARVPPPVPNRTPTVRAAHPQPMPARTPTASTSTAPAPARQSNMTKLASLAASTSTLASASTSTSSSAQTHRPKSVHDTGDVNAMRHRMVREMMEQLRVDHDCNHGQWHYRRGGGRCQTCGHNLPLYLFRCQGCEMLACNRCRRNRL